MTAEELDSAAFLTYLVLVSWANCHLDALANFEMKWLCKLAYNSQLSTRVYISCTRLGTNEDICTNSQYPIDVIWYRRTTDRQ